MSFSFVFLILDDFIFRANLCLELKLLKGQLYFITCSIFVLIRYIIVLI
jgi:hypothetical protein